jgi:two-component system CheB/CheR fusion protein
MYRKVDLNSGIEVVSSSGPHVLDIAHRARRPINGCRVGYSAQDAEAGATVFIVEDNSAVREAMRDLLCENGYQVENFADGSSFLESYRPGRNECVVIDVQMPGMSGIELIQRLRSIGHEIPVIVVTDNATVPIAVRAIKAGASDFIEKPVRSAGLLSSIKMALDQAERGAGASVAPQAAAHFSRLTLRERQILDLVLAGRSNKRIAGDLGISQRTVEVHRAAIMSKTGSRSLSSLIRATLCSGCIRRRRPFQDWRRRTVRFGAGMGIGWLS